MPAFSRHNDFFAASLATGSSSVLVRLRFGDDHDRPPKVTVRVPDKHFGNSSDAEVAASVSSAVNRANLNFNVSYRIREPGNRSIT